MPEEGFSFFEIQTPPGKFNPPQTKRFPGILQILKPPLYFSDPKWPTPQHLGGGGRSYGRLGLPSISATRKVRENTKK